MEEDIHIQTKTPVSALVEKRLDAAIELAKKKIDYESAHNPELLQAIHIVEAFLKKKKRVCYGGTAMNMILPPSKRFYDMNYEIPDYDFFTPDAKADTEELIEMLKHAGFKDIHSKIGIHEGTQKVLVNFTPIADISSLSPDIYTVFLKKSIVKKGIHYTYPDILRMMMYLELSRPRGDVSRWSKVYERLELLNKEFPVKIPRVRCTRKNARKYEIPLELRSLLYSFVIENQRILVNGSLTQLYTQGILHGDSKLSLLPGGCVAFVSPSPKRDAKQLRDLLQAEAGDSRLKFILHSAKGELVPERVEIVRDEVPVCLILAETACHSYSTVQYEDGRTILIGSIEFLITLYSALGFFIKDSGNYFDGVNPLCFLKQLIHLSRINIRTKTSQFPPFALTCKGYQKGFASLVKERFQRIQKEKMGRPSSTRRKSKRGTLSE